MGRYVSSYFSPGRGCGDVVIGFLDRCDQTIDAAIYSITHDGIAAALLRAQARGVAVRVLVDKTQAAGRHADDEELELAGVDLRRDTQRGLMHHKFVIGDGTALATGSFNWTSGADKRNAENFMVVRLRYAIAAYQEQFDAIWLLNAPLNAPPVVSPDA